MKFFLFTWWHLKHQNQIAILHPVCYLNSNSIQIQKLNRKSILNAAQPWWPNFISFKIQLQIQLFFIFGLSLGKNSANLSQKHDEHFALWDTVYSTVCSNTLLWIHISLSFLKITEPSYQEFKPSRDSLWHQTVEPFRLKPGRLFVVLLHNVISQNHQSVFTRVEGRWLGMFEKDD